jgi:Zn-dependent protease/tetratricopeptide (TPR) repeat protein
MVASESPFSLRFSLVGFPVVVEPGFWVVMALLGFNAYAGAPLFLALWLAVGFVSILLHELGHAVAMRHYGSGAHIRLQAFGGVTFSDRPFGRWQQVAVSVAGPAAGFLLGGLVVLAAMQWPPRTALAAALVGMLKFANFGWGLLNLVPVPPLDGGHVLQGVVGPRRQRLAFGIGAAVATGIALWAGFIMREPYMALVFGYFAVQAYRAWKELPSDAPARRRPAAPSREPQRGAPEAAPKQGGLVQGAPREAAASGAQVPAATGGGVGAHDPLALGVGAREAWTRGWEALRAGRTAEARDAAAQALEAARNLAEQNAARDLHAWVALEAGDTAGARRHLEAVEPPEAARSLTRARVLDALGRKAEAAPHALAAFEREPSEFSAALAVRLLSLEGRLADAERVASGFPFSQPGLREALLAQVATVAGRHGEAARLAATAFERAGRPEDALHAARAHALLGSEDAAAQWLLRALGAGLADVDAVRRDPALAAVRARPDVTRRLG